MLYTISFNFHSVNEGATFVIGIEGVQSAVFDLESSVAGEVMNGWSHVLSAICEGKSKRVVDWDDSTNSLGRSVNAPHVIASEIVTTIANFPSLYLYIHKSL